VDTQNENINDAQCYKSADYRKGFSMTYHMRDMKKPAPAGETLAQALLALALAMSATALILAIGAAVVCT
jgi:hypothetical protein